MALLVTVKVRNVQGQEFELPIRVSNKYRKLKFPEVQKLVSRQLIEMGHTLIRYISYQAVA